MGIESFHQKTVTLTGLSGRSYDFEVYEIGQSFNPLAAIYVFLTPSIYRYTQTVVYVGETHDIKARLSTDLLQHHRLACAQRNGATLVGIYRAAEMVNRDFRLAVEADIRRAYDPPCNRQ